MDEAKERQDRHSTVVGQLGRRVLQRHSRRAPSGTRLAEAVARRHEPPSTVAGATRLAPVSLRRHAVDRSPAAADPAAGEVWTPSTTESTVMPGVSDWAAEWLFGDQDKAV